MLYGTLQLYFKISLSVTNIMLTRLAFTLLAAVTVALAAISVAGYFSAPPSLYTSMWMVTLWALTAVAAVGVMLRRRLWRRPVLAAMHGALLLILAGALLTHLTATESDVHLRVGESAAEPAAVTLADFEVVTYPGTSAPADFVTTLLTSDGDTVRVSMNRPAAVDGYRVMQGAYDSDGAGVTLSVSRDAWGRGVTYAGYILLGVTFVLYFMMRRTSWRAALRALRGAALIAALAVAPALSASVSDEWRMTAVFHNGRICPMTTLARDFTVNVTGSDCYDGYSADEVLAGYLFEFGEWKSKPAIRIKDKELRGILGVMDGHVSYETFYRATADGRLDIDDPAVQCRYGDDIQRFEAVNMLIAGALIKVFPAASPDGTVTWYAPGDDLPRDMEHDRWAFIRKFLGLYNEQVVRGDTHTQRELLEALARYQRRETGDAMPTPSRMRLESFYNRISDPLAPALMTIAAGLVLTVCIALSGAPGRRVSVAGMACAALLLILLTVMGVCRWIVSGHVPLSNGYETMIFMAWCLALAGVLTRGRSLLTPMALTGAGLALAVAAMSGSAASVTGLMPVLQSPLLSIHVVCVMAAYALFLLMAMTGAVALIWRRTDAARLASLNIVMLYPALMLLAAGIFIGAVWADVSWGRYWGWDPKEVWALITMLIYSIPAHPTLLVSLRRRRILHLYCLLAFLSVIITYFGVNFILGGLHSYA